MINFKEIIQDSELISAYLYANTPNYLYDKFRSSITILNLSKLESANLVNDLEYYLNRTEKSFNDYLIIHAILIALSFKAYDEVKGIFEQIHTFPINWARQLEEVILKNQVSFFEQNKEFPLNEDTIKSSTITYSND